MKTKNTILLLIVAIVILGVIYYQKRTERQSLEAAAIPQQTIPAVTSGTLEKIEIQMPGTDMVTLSRSDDKWFTNVQRKYEADENAVKSVMAALEKPIETTVVSSNPESFDEYEVTKTSGTWVRVFEKGKPKPTLNVLVGKNGPTAFSSYVRLDNADQVLNAKTNLAMLVDRSQGWRNHQIFDFSGGNTNHIETKGTSSTFTVKRNDNDKWMFQGKLNGQAQSAKITSLANMVASLRAQDFVDPKDNQKLADFGLDPVHETIDLVYEDKTTSPSKEVSVSLLIGNESAKAGNYYAKRADKNDIFTIGDSVVKALTPDPDSIKVTPPPSPSKSDSPTTATQTMNKPTSSPSATNPVKKAPVARAAKSPTPTAAKSNPTSHTVKVKSVDHKTTHTAKPTTTNDTQSSGTK